MINDLPARLSRNEIFFIDVPSSATAGFARHCRNGILFIDKMPTETAGQWKKWFSRIESNDKQLKPIIIFDGVCNLCNGWVDFVLKRDREKKFLFASYQQPEAKELMSKFGYDEPPSILLIENGILYSKSNAVLRIFSVLGMPYNLISVFKIVPGFIRDFIYDTIANNRYKWFGKRKDCRLPASGEADRFLSSKS